MTMHTLHTLSLTLSIALALAAGPAFAGPDNGPALGSDHLKCFKVKDELAPKTVLTADVDPQQNPPFRDENCRIELPASHFCIDVAKSNVLDRNDQPWPTLPITGPATGDFLCYRMRCDREVVDVETADQFRIRQIQTKRSDFFCAPAEKVDPM
jgi:hypothetical protein